MGSPDTCESIIFNFPNTAPPEPEGKFNTKYICFLLQKKSTLELI